MSEGKFWLGIFMIILAAILGITAATTHYYKHQQRLIVEMVANGTDPIEARCALYDSFSYEGSALICMEVAKK